MEFPRDLPGAEASSARWKEHRAEVDSRKDAVSRFLSNGHDMINDKHFLSDEVSCKHYISNAMNPNITTEMLDHHRFDLALTSPLSFCVD